MSAANDPVVLGVDCSTTACKAVAWNARGEAVAEGRSAFPIENPGPDAWEQDAEHWWRATSEAVKSAVAGLGDRVQALCVTHQRETVVVTDEAGRPLHRALVWMDARCRKEVTRAVQSLGAERIHTLSGKPPCTTPSLYKLMFLFERGAPELRALRPRVLDVHAFLVERLTGRLATSYASADPLGIVDMQARDWSDELIGLLGIERSQLPELVAPGAEIGRISARAAEACGLRAGVPVIAGAGDGQAAGLGAGIVETGRAYLNLGTAVVSGVLSKDYRTDTAFRTLYGAAPDTFFLETDLKGGTFTLDWLAEKFLAATTRPLDETLAELERAAENLPPGSDGLVLVPYWNAVMNPYWDDSATGVVIGFHGGHGPEHFYRAVLEGIALEQRLHTGSVERAARVAIDELVVMGGGSKSRLWCQILADVMQKRVVRAKTQEATALGAGILAATAAGLHPTLGSAVSEMTATAEAFEPGPQRGFYDRLYDKVYSGIYPALRERLTALAELREAAEQKG